MIDHLVIVRVVLKAAAGIDHAGDAQPVQLAHKTTRRIGLILRRQFGTFGERRIKNEGVRFRDENPHRIAARIARDLAAGRVRRILRVSHRLQCGAIQ